jgi:hypothetical protein
MKTVALKFNEFSAEVPEGWHDESQIIFTMPNTEGPAPSRANVVFTWENAQPGSESTYLEEHMRRLAGIVPFRVLEEGHLGEGTDSMHFIEVQLGYEQRPMNQMLIAKRIDGKMAVITGTAMRHLYPQLRETFLEIARKLKQA